MLVIGGGISGMTAALLLAKQGHKVKIVEKHCLGVLIAGFVRNGLHFDTGFHYAGGLHEGGILQIWLKSLGLWELCCFEAIEAELYRHKDHTLFLPSGYQAGLEALNSYFPGYQDKIQSFFQNMEQVLSRSAYTNPKSELIQGHNSGFSSLGLMDYLNELNFPEELKQTLAIRSLLYGVTPDQASFAEFSMVAGPYFQSCYSLVGGGRALVNAFKQVLAQANVEVICNQAVEKFELNADKKIQAALLENGEKISCSHCIFTGHPQQLEHLLPPKVLRPAYFTRIRQMEESSFGFMLFAESQSDFLDQRTMFVRPNFAIQALEEAEPSIYLSSSSKVGKRRAIIAIAPLKNVNQIEDYATWKQTLTHKLAKHVLEYCPELKTGFKVLDSATPISFKHWNHGCKGGLYGLAHAKDSLPLSPATKISNLFLAGQNILLPGLLGGIISGAIAAGFIVGPQQILEGLCSE